VTCGYLSGAVEERSVNEVVETFTHPEQDLLISKLKQPVVYPGVCVKWVDVSRFKEKKAKKRPRHSEEIEVVVVSARNPKNNPNINENGLRANGFLAFNSQDFRCVNGHIRRSQLDKIQISFSKWWELTPRDNGAGVFVVNERCECELVGIVSAHLMGEDSKAPILNLALPRIREWIEEQCLR
jgi:hypothetical protein